MHETASDVIQEVRDYYDRQPEREWRRLIQHRLEYAITLRALRDTLPEHARILDVGGGPGRYAVALAAAGHTVTLVDLSPRLLARAQEHAAERKVRLAGIVEASATDLYRFGDADFDAVLMLGPLYHLPKAKDRAQAAGEARRVLVPGGALVAAFLGRYAPLRQLARSDPKFLIEAPERYEVLLEQGVLPGPPVHEEVAQGYYARPEEIAPLLQEAGFDPPRLLAVEGLLEGIEERVSALQGPAWNAWADLLYDLADDPGLLAFSTHMLAIARRPPSA